MEGQEHTQNEGFFQLCELPAGQRTRSGRERHHFRCAFGRWSVLIFVAIFRAAPERPKGFFRCGRVRTCRTEREL